MFPISYMRIILLITAQNVLKNATFSLISGDHKTVWGKKQSVEMLVFAGLICLRATFEILGISCKRSALHSLIIPSVSLHFHCKDTIPKEEGKKSRSWKRKMTSGNFCFHSLIHRAAPWRHGCRSFCLGTRKYWAKRKKEKCLFSLDQSAVNNYTPVRTKVMTICVFVSCPHNLIVSIQNVVWPFGSS